MMSKAAFYRGASCGFATTIFLLFASTGADAQTAPAYAETVSSCGSVTYVAGRVYPTTQDTSGRLCGTVTATNPSVGTNGATAPTSSTQVGGVDASGNLQNVTVGNQAVTKALTTTGAVASTLAPAISALSTTAGIVLASGTAFVSRVVCNYDATITEYFGASNVTSAGANGARLLPGQCWDFSHTTAAVYGVSASGTPNAGGVQY